MRSVDGDEDDDDKRMDPKERAGVTDRARGWGDHIASFH